MDFIYFEAAEENLDLNFSDEEQTNDEMDLSGIGNYNKFPNQTRNRRSAVY